ncbi:hypothetical protein CRE_28496 [Caenorhabditis remanei]|uniref:Uncharacterized protein n=1 Tax=Caenorhabditis remanei TaxID=31234 RepID=E3LMS5_CAERE|nr:hypothetical protein CRE_28496 [Caenorhabditis remanei]
MPPTEDQVVAVQKIADDEEQEMFRVL